MLLGLVAVVLIFICLVVWINVIMVRRGKAKVQSNTIQHDKMPEQAPAGHMPSPQEEPSDLLLDSTAVVEAKKPPVVESLVDEPPVEEPWRDDVEVVPNDTTPTQKVFARNTLPYVLHGASVPEFDVDDWHQSFLRLTQDSNVMGWIGFHDETVGASDREYDQAFLETLRSYRRSVMKLQHDVGLSSVLETSVVGEEGKIWFMTGDEDVWFALFVERNADVREIAKGFAGHLITAQR